MNILLVQENPEHTELLTEVFSSEMQDVFHLSSVYSLKEALKLLETQSTELILLELSLPDSHGLNAFNRISRFYPHIPIIILTSLDDEMTALQAIRRGAQDYVLKGDINSKFLKHVMTNAIERHKMQTDLHHLVVTDELTELLNRRGFNLLAEQQVKLAKRDERKLLFVSADVDDFKEINDQYGHAEGDIVLIHIAQAFKNSFRKSDIIGRIGGDEFAIIVIDASEKDCSKMIKRVQQKLSLKNKKINKNCNISVSFGMVAYDSEQHTFLEQLMTEADKALYEQKKSKKNKNYQIGG